ncbi:MAG: NlpC/P60 family protein [Alphaproteobacteria bacterium]|nr:MAG: NlpC/P60 family protein [Alphaproteobacteria bacterium]
MAADPRLTLARPGEPAPDPAALTPHRVIATVATLWADPGRGRAVSQLLRGEGFLVARIRGGMAWGQAAHDGYVGHVEADALGAPGPAPTHHVAVPLTHLYPAPDIKAPPGAALPLGAPVTVLAMGERFAETPEGFLPRGHLADRPAADPVAVAEMFLHAPYLWGGRSVMGIDCSGLVQQAFRAAGHPMPRDSDMQAATGRELAPAEALRRGDLVFWRGHVGIMRDGATLLHANAFHMQVASEPLAEAEARIAASGGGPVIARRRWA